MNLAIKDEKKLIDKYPAADVKGIIKRKIDYFNRNPFKQKTREIFIEEIKEFLYLENLDFIEIDKEKEKDTPKEQTEEVLSEKETKKLLKEIYQDILKVLKKFCDLKEEFYPIVAIWILGTYIHDEFETFPYLFFNAMRGSGKTRILRLVASLSKNGELLGSMSESVLFRTASETTMCIDEFEQVNSQEKQSLRELLNSAYKRGQKIKRMKKTKDGYEVEEFEVYTSICMANIWGMEEVLGDRCITILLEKSGKPIITKLIENFQNDAEITTLKQKLKKIQCSLCNVVMSKPLEIGWNNYILDRYSSDITDNNTYITLTTQTTTDYTFYEKIDKMGIDGRHFELTFPLLVIARYLGSFDEFLEIIKKMVQEKKVEDFVESKDIQLFDFVSRQDAMNFVSITKLTSKFRDFIGVDEKEETYVNSRWMGRALKRLALVREKVRKSGGVEVVLDITNAKKRLEMFK